MKTNFTRVFVDKDRYGTYVVSVYKFWGLFYIGNLRNTGTNVVSKDGWSISFKDMKEADNAAKEYLAFIRQSKTTRYEIFEEVQSVWRD